MLMSKSRLEKFLYALYSLDSSDLPTPLSRIEELYKCLVTGEEPLTFEPLSRVEKYLMVILGVYDVDSLPNPLSRVEVLLHKLATGNDNLDDVKSFLSEHEELLAEIIRNGGVGGNIDIEYVLYTLSTEFNTLYNTAEKPVKSAILKGNTLVNLSANKGYTTVAFTITQTYKAAFQYNIESYKPNTKYLVITEFNHDYKYNFGVNIPHASAIFNENILIENGVGRVYKHILTTKSDLTGCNTALRTVVYNNTEETYFSQTFRIMIIEYQEGMENWDIPYFEGMQSVKMPVVTTSNENGTKTNILTTSEEVELRGVGEVKDELNLVTGELTQRVEEIILDGSNLTFSTAGGGDTYIRFSCRELTNMKPKSEVVCENFPGNVSYKEMMDNGMEGIGCYYEKIMYLCISYDKLGVDATVGDSAKTSALKTWLNNNPIKTQYQLEQEITESIDISTVDQDGNNTELSTFNDITHVTLSSEGLIPEAEMEVATKNEEVLNTMSLEMNDISTTQNALQETSNIQSENVDATMIATTEIYEGLL